MSMEMLSLSSLAKLDNGKINIAINQAIMRLVHDCHDRPALKKPRKLALTLSFTPQPDEKGRLDTADVCIDIKDSIPGRATRAYNMAAGQHGLLFNELSLEDIKQHTLDMAGLKINEEEEGGEDDS